MSVQRMERTMFETSRVAEYFDARELQECRRFVEGSADSASNANEKKEEERARRRS